MADVEEDLGHIPKETDGPQIQIHTADPEPVAQLPEARLSGRSRASARNRISVMQADAMKSSRHVLEHRKRVDKGNPVGDGQEDEPLSTVLVQVEAAKQALMAARREHLAHLAVPEDVDTELAALKEELAASQAHLDSAEAAAAAGRGDAEHSLWRLKEEELRTKAADEKIKSLATELAEVRHDLMAEKEAHLSSQRQMEEALASQHLEVERERREAHQSWSAKSATVAELAAAEEKSREYETTSAQQVLQLQALQEEVAAGVEDRQRCQQQTERVEAMATRQDGELSEAREAKGKLKEEMASLRQELEAQEAFSRQESSLRARLVEECHALENWEKLENHNSLSPGGVVEETDARVDEEIKSLRRTETDLRRAIAAHRYVVRHLINDKPLLPSTVSSSKVDEDDSKTVKLSSPPSGRDCQDFLFAVPARPMSASAVAWLRGTSESEAL